ncbi:DMT family transporter [Oscillibacter sp.]|uniref:DMT family transporter n=1 Tax=Oscillibacter sp. TaxID=1945593 RepID=UPI00260965E2|nr:DMT family transporter [Oscillibacter sp.]MDD3347349.1 DMT family transporter [Oscillibacter sp.]
MTRQEKLPGYLFALFTITVWGSTFISSKLLLEFYTPSQIMLTRFLLAYGALWLLRPRKLSLSRKQEAAFFLLGLAGCSIYFYTENTALTYTLASNVSILVAAAPIFTAVLAHFTGEESFRRSTFFGFLTAFSGVVLVVCNGTFILKLNPRGDLLALAAALCWAVYSVLLRRVSQGLDPILVTRRTLFWGVVTAFPLVALEGLPYPVSPLSMPLVTGNFLFLGLIGSALCYVLWNKAFHLLGVVSTNNFIYLNPFVTIVAARLFLKESISPLALLGAILITVGVVVSQRPARQVVSQTAEFHS